MITIKNKPLKSKMLLCIVVTLITASGCTDETKQAKNAAKLVTIAVLSGIEQSRGSRKPPVDLVEVWYQTYDWRAEDYFDDPQVIELCRAIEQKDLVLVDKLITERTDVNTKGKDNMTPLLWAYYPGQ